MVRLTNQWGSFEATEVEAARLRAGELPDDMRRAVTWVKLILGGIVIHAGPVR